MTLLSHTDHSLHIRAPSLSVLSECKNEGQYSSSAFSFFSSYLKKKKKPEKKLDRSLKFPGSCWRLPLAHEELTYMQMKQRSLAASDPEREEEDQEYTHVPRALEKTPPTPSMLKLHN